MPSAGSTRPNTMSSGSFTTPRQRPVSTITLSATLVKRPKKPFQSPATHQVGDVAVRAPLIAFSCSCKGCQQRRGGRDPAEDAALRLDHRDAGSVEFGEVRAGAVFQHQAVEAAVVGLAHRGVDADLGGDAADEKLRDVAAAQHGFEV